MNYYKYINGEDELTKFTAEWEIVKYRDDVLVTPRVAELLEKIGFSFPNKAGRCVPMYNRLDHSIVELGNPGSEWILAPTQSQAQTFLRDVIKIDLSVAPIYMDETRTDFKYYFYILGHVDEDAEETYYDVYEEALEYGLVKTINIVKNGK